MYMRAHTNIHTQIKNICRNIFDAKILSWHIIWWLSIWHIKIFSVTSDKWYQFVWDTFKMCEQNVGCMCTDCKKCEQYSEQCDKKAQTFLLCQSGTTVMAFDVLQWNLYLCSFFIWLKALCWKSTYSMHDGK